MGSSGSQTHWQTVVVGRSSRQYSSAHSHTCRVHRYLCSRITNINCHLSLLLAWISRLIVLEGVYTFSSAPRHISYMCCKELYLFIYVCLHSGCSLTPPISGYRAVLLGHLSLLHWMDWMVTTWNILLSRKYHS